jgi:acyl carrier protein
MLAEDAEIPADLDLGVDGLSSFAMVEVLLAVEEEFQVEIPDGRLNWSTFRTTRSLWDTVLDVRATARAGTPARHE